MTNEELNEAVARKLGWVQNPHNPDGPFGRPIKLPEKPIGSETHRVAVFPTYSTSIEAAWEIVGFVNSKFLLMTMGQELGNAEWSVIIRHNDPTMQNKYYGRADTAPMAICLAFLKLS